MYIAYSITYPRYHVVYFLVLCEIFGCSYVDHVRKHVFLNYNSTFYSTGMLLTFVDVVRIIDSR